MMNLKPIISLSKQRFPNTAAIDQGVIVSKIDRFDKYVDQHSLKLYIEEQKQRESAASQKRLLKESKLGSRNNIMNITNTQYYNARTAVGAYSELSSNILGAKYQKQRELSKQHQYSPHHHRSKTMMNLMKAGSGKPKKTILVKVSSNEALNSNKSEMATRQEGDELINSSHKAFAKQKSKEQISVNLGGVKVRRANSKEGTLMDEYAHLKESTEQLTLVNKTLRPQEEDLEPTMPLKSMDLQAMEDFDDQTTE